MTIVFGVDRCCQDRTISQDPIRGFAIGVVTQSSFSAQNSNFLLAPAPILSGLQVEKFAELAVHKTVTRHTKTAYAPRPTHT